MRKYRTKLILLAVFSALFAAIAALSLSGTIEAFELSVYNNVAKLIGPAMTQAMKAVTYAGSFPLLCGLSVLLIIIPPVRRYGFAAGITAGISALVNLILKQIFRRGRPDVLRLVSESGFGFPSGHTQSSTAFFAAVLLILLINVRDKKILIPMLAVCVIIPFIVGISRIYLGVHHAGDVLAGWAAGACLALSVNIVWQMLGGKLTKHEKLHRFFWGGADGGGSGPQTRPAK